MSIFRTYIHSVPVSGPEYKGKVPRTKSYSYPIIREEKDGSSANPHQGETLHFEGDAQGAFNASITFGQNVLNSANKTDLLSCYDPEYVTLRGLNDISGLELDPQRWTEGGGTRDGMGLKATAALNKINGFIVDEDKSGLSTYLKSLDETLWIAVQRKLVSQGEKGEKRAAKFGEIRSK